MRDHRERLAVLHRRSDEIRHGRDAASLFMQGAGCTVLFILLALTVGMYSGGAEPVSLYTGASLLDENAGGYVLVAVIAFMAGAAVTAYLIKRRNITKNRTTEKENNNESN